MSASPFEIFRRNLKPLMVLLTLLALFSFVVLPALDTYMRRGGGMGADPVAASFDGTTLTRSRVARTTRNHAAVVRFLSELAGETIRRKGVPQVPGFQYDEETKQIQSLGIDANPNEEATINTLRFYNEATKAGFELDDTAIKNWLTRFTDGIVSDEEIVAMVMRSSGNQLGQQHLYEQLRMHLLADLYQRGFLAGLTNNQMPVSTPLAQWQNFQKMNQKATVTAYGVLVSEYFDDTDENPSEGEIQRVYDEGSERLSYPDSLSALPSFRRPDSAEIEYLSGDLTKFIEAEKAKISEEQIRAEYERRLAGGDFQLPAENPQAQITPDVSEPDAGKSDATEPQATESDATEAGASGSETTEPEMAGPEAAEPETETAEPEAAEPETAEPETAEPETTEPETAEPETTEPETTEPEATESAAPTEPASEDSSMNQREQGAVRLVVFQDEKSGESKDEKPAASEPETPRKTEDEQPKTEKSEKPEESTEKESPAKDEAPSEDKQPAAEQDAMSLELDDEPAPSQPQPFEEVRDEIATQLATESARRARDQAIAEANKRMRHYFTEYAVHESNVEVGIQTEAEAPERLDLKKLADELELTYGKTQGPVNRVSVTETEVGESSGLGGGLNSQGTPYAAMMFGARMQDGSELPPQPVFSPLRSVSSDASTAYISWKTEDTPAHLPELDEVRDEVVKFIRMQQAQELAKAHAEELARKLADENQTFSDVIPEDKTDNLIEAVGPFSWLEQAGMMRTVVSEVRELNAVGEEFMKAVFTTEVNHYAVAPNDPQTVYYVVEPTEFQPDLEELHEQFRQPQGRFMAMLLGNDDARNILRGVYESVDERTGFEMKLAEEQ